MYKHVVGGLFAGGREGEGKGEGEEEEGIRKNRGRGEEVRRRLRWRDGMRERQNERECVIGNGREGEVGRDRDGREGEVGRDRGQ